MDLKSIFEMPLARRQRRLAATRPPIARVEFVNQSASTDLGKAAAAILWDKLEEIKSSPAFSPYPSDDFLHVYGLAEEDLDIDLVLHILRALNCRIPDKATLDAIGPINNPKELIRLVEASVRAAERGPIDGGL